MFVGCRSHVAILESSETGNLTFSRNLTATGRLEQVSWSGTNVAVDSRPGQLWVGYYIFVYQSENATIFYRNRVAGVYLIDIVNGSVIQEFEVPGRNAPAVSKLLSGELLVTTDSRAMLLC